MRWMATSSESWEDGHSRSFGRSFFPSYQKKLQLYPFTITLEETSNSVKDPFKIFLEYNPLTEHTTYVLPKITLEIGGRSMQEPNTPRPIQSLIKEAFPGLAFLDGEFPVLVASVEKTFLDKLFLLHETFQCPPGQINIERMSRHLYDLVQISKTKYADLAISDPGLYKEIVTHRRVFTPIKDVDYDLHFPPNLNPIPPENLNTLWSEDYKKTKEQMIVGEAPGFSLLIKSIQNITEKINNHGQ